MEKPQKLNRTEQETHRFYNDFSPVSKCIVIDPFAGAGTTTLGGNIIRGVIYILEAR
jgi:hypothetical protein